MKIYIIFNIVNVNEINASLFSVISVVLRQSIIELRLLNTYL
jgi:hypothetical protein